MPKKKIYRTVTKHAVTRGNQRLGSTKNGIDALTKRAKQDGLGWYDTTGELRRMLSSRSVHGCTPKYYANAIYVFGKGNILVTVLNIDTSFDKMSWNIDIPSNYGCIRIWFDHPVYITLDTAISSIRVESEEQMFAKMTKKGLL